MSASRCFTSGSEALRVARTETSRVAVTVSDVNLAEAVTEHRPPGTDSPTHPHMPAPNGGRTSVSASRCFTSGSEAMRVARTETSRVAVTVSEVNLAEAVTEHRPPGGRTPCPTPPSRDGPASSDANTPSRVSSAALEQVSHGLRAGFLPGFPGRTPGIEKIAH